MATAFLQSCPYLTVNRCEEKREMGEKSLAEVQVPTILGSLLYVSCAELNPRWLSTNTRAIISKY